MPATPEGWDLERYRPLLRIRARRLELDARFRRRFDSSDLVQEALLRAHEGLGRFAGGSEAELMVWLQEILGNVLVDEVRKARARRRDVARDRAVETARWCPAVGDPPGEQWDRQERLLRLAALVDRLPEDQRAVVTQRDLLGASVGQIAELTGKTEKSVAGLLLRGRRRLRELIEDDGRDDGTLA